MSQLDLKSKRAEIPQRSSKEKSKPKEPPIRSNNWPLNISKNGQSPRKRSWKEDQRILDHDIIDAWGTRKAIDTTRRDVILLLDAVKEISGESEYVFPSPKAGHIAPSAVGKALRRHLKELKEPITRECAEWFTPHDLRRTAATKMTESGINRLAVSKVLNHAESGVTAVYDRHSYDKEKRQALETWGRKLDAIINGESEANVIPMNRKEA